MINKTCPSCQSTTTYGVHTHFPFCSARCRDNDLLGWAKGERTLSTPITDADDASEWAERMERELE